MLAVALDKILSSPLNLLCPIFFNPATCLLPNKIFPKSQAFLGLVPTEAEADLGFPKVAACFQAHSGSLVPPELKDPPGSCL